MTPDHLLERYRKDLRTTEWLERWNETPAGRSTGLHGASGSLKALAAACATVALRRLVVVRSDKEDAAYFFNDLEKLLPPGQAVFYPDSFRRPYAFEETANANVVLRAEVLNRLGRPTEALVVVTYPEALFEQVVSHKTLQGQTFSLAVGDALGLDFLNETLFDLHFERTDFVTEPGEFAVRGGIVDVFSYAFDRPYRIEFLGDRIDSIRTFDVESQWSDGTVERMDVVPNIENKSVLETREYFWDFVPSDTRWWVESTEVVGEKLERDYARAEEAFAQLSGPIQRGEPHKLFANRARWEAGMAQRCLTVDGEGTHATVHWQTLPSPAFGKNFSLLADTVENHRRLGRTVVLMAHAQTQIDRLRTLFQDMGRLVEFEPVLGALHSGWEDPVGGLVVYTDHELFERYQRFRLKNGFDKAHAITLQELQSLQMGDFVTHLDHGVGKFGGLQKIDVGGAIQEAIKLIYRDNDVLYVSIHSLHKIAKFNAKDGTAPALHKLGSGAWQTLKAKAKKRVKEMAYDLIQLYARRKDAPGHAFAPDTYLQHELEASFVYEDTPDQVKSTADVKADMEKPRPMDRLVCGDVGFGKTEIAIRAAFKAATDGKQVAILVPTTLLAFQHFKTFSKRLASFPVRVDYLNRTRSAKETKAILQDLAAGKIDILIGTHKLVGKDVHFKDLGLLVVDEEQKFGVNVKDKLKTLRVQLDTLTLTATPIPRTLYSALVGLKDLSSIQTPPPGRKPIKTFLAPFDPLLVREAILFELERGGKVFYVHDRVASIEARRRFLENLVPEARIGVVHGQMPESLIEETMLLFAEGAYDVLLATTIIEAGLDVPEANTILIERADRLGLATLYQLRGRVGRREEEAYAYLFHPPRLTEAAEKRLAAIADLSDLGSGHLLAERDMEIRGVGNLLGPEQHGHIRALSLEVYTELLEEAIRKLKGEAKEERRHVTLDLALSARLPAEYVGSLEARSRYYSRFAEAKSLAELSRLVRELKERYGPLPEEAENFVALARLRLVAERKGVVSITEGLTHLEVVFPRYPLDYDARGLKGLPYRVELTQYPPGFRLEKKGLRPRDYPEALMEVLYLFADL